MKIKARKQGTVIFLPVPASFQIKDQQEFELKQLSDRTLQFTPLFQEIYPPIWEDDPAVISQFNQEIGSADDKSNYGLENVNY
ncbi:hypothetical protein LPAF129_10850 [Ligilactobacillus pabuli]|uniref:AbrB family transcriptional regulator n=1 Tax=Ligilactobacillus pabuli TaxID=2886039 RepID=A0ABQ5JH45_9LACO|nr:hypothetical protein [Ligilactobacillus pabuli]GKS81399.1 hypothetical protein LPAF129_10850 [Ligilactobacillus pabuli]